MYAGGGERASGLSGAAGAPGGPILRGVEVDEVGVADIDRLIAAFDPAEGREIVRAATADGRAGHPVLFGRRFFEDLRSLSGDQGARSILAAAAEFVVEIPTTGDAALVDLDTPEDWAAWRAGRA